MFSASNKCASKVGINRSCVEKSALSLLNINKLKNIKKFKKYSSEKFFQEQKVFHFCS